MSYGQDTTLGISFQNSFNVEGSVNISSLHFIEFIDEGLSPTKEQLTRQGMKGLFDENEDQEGKNTLEADITIEGMSIPTGLLLNAIFDRTTTSVGSYYSHSFKPKQADFDNFSAMRPMTGFVDLTDGGSSHLYPDMVASKIELNIANGEFLTAKLSVLGGNYAQTNSVNADSATFITGDAIDWSISSLSFNGTGNCEVSELTITSEESLESKWTLCTSKSPTRIKRSDKRIITVNGTIQFDNQTEYQKFINQTTQPFVTTFFMGSEMLKVDIPRMKYVEFPIPVGAPGQMEVSFSAKAKYHTGSGTAMEITVVNTASGNYYG